MCFIVAGVLVLAVGGVCFAMCVWHVLYVLCAPQLVIFFSSRSYASCCCFPWHSALSSNMLGFGCFGHHVVVGSVVLCSLF